MYSHVINDSLVLHHESYGDVDFVKDEKKLKSILRENKPRLRNVLIYGKTNVAPFHEYYVRLNDKNRRQAIDFNEEFTKDTVVGGYDFIFTGFSLDGLNPKPDFDQIFKNIVVDSTYNKEIGSFYEVLNSFSKSNRFLNALREIEQFPVYGKNKEFFKFQMKLTYASFLGKNQEYVDLLEQWERGGLKDSIKTIIDNNSIRGHKEVSRFILHKAENEKLVMFNENHFYPNHRKLLTSLLPELKKLGFTHLALEALGEKQDSLLNSGNPMNVETGFYTREQNFAKLIRTAQLLDFEFVAYESFEDNADRETMQAENLYQKTFAKDKNTKVLVLAGIAHIYESPDTQGKTWMASILKEKYGIDPVTFSQTTLNQYSGLTKDLAIINSQNFDQERYKTTDYLILNNLKDDVGAVNFWLKNEYEKPIQLALFDNSEFKTELSFFDRVPMKSYLLMPNETYSTEVNGTDLRMILFDGLGKVLENKTLKNGFSISRQ